MAYHREFHNCNILAGGVRALKGTPQRVVRPRKSSQVNTNSKQPSSINHTHSESLASMNPPLGLFFFEVNLSRYYWRDNITYNLSTCICICIFSYTNVSYIAHMPTLGRMKLTLFPDLEL